MNLESRVSLLESRKRLDKTPEVKIYALGKSAIAEILSASIGSEVDDFLLTDGELLELLAQKGGGH